ncbi:thiamine pyrophosphate-dependent enzyme [Shigella flexneri]
MGFGLPAALGVKMALPDETVVRHRDGSIQMNIRNCRRRCNMNCRCWSEPR